MPIYCYHCDDCGRDDEEFQSIRSIAIDRCPVCTSKTYHRVPTLSHSMDRAYAKPIEMQSIALNDPDDIRAFIRRNPNVPMSENPHDPLYGVPVARTRAEKLRILKNEGFQEKN